jgi:hypothetical protein
MGTDVFSDAWNWLKGGGGAALAALDFLTGGTISSIMATVALTASAIAAAAAGTVLAITSPMITSFGTNKKNGNFQLGVTGAGGLFGSTVEFGSDGPTVADAFAGPQLPGTKLGVGYDFQEESWFDEEQAAGSYYFVKGSYHHKQFWKSGEQWFDWNQGVGLYFSYGNASIGGGVSYGESYHSKWGGDPIQKERSNVNLDVGVSYGLSNANKNPYGSLNFGFGAEWDFDGRGNYMGMHYGPRIGFNKSMSMIGNNYSISGGLSLGGEFNQYYDAQGNYIGSTTTGTVGYGINKGDYGTYGFSSSITGGMLGGKPIFDMQGRLVYTPPHSQLVISTERFLNAGKDYHEGLNRGEPGFFETRVVKGGDTPEFQNDMQEFYAEFDKGTNGKYFNEDGSLNIQAMNDEIDYLSNKYEFTGDQANDVKWANLFDKAAFYHDLRGALLENYYSQKIKPYLTDDYNIGTRSKELFINERNAYWKGIVESDKALVADVRAALSVPGYGNIEPNGSDIRYQELYNQNDWGNMVLANIYGNMMVTIFSSVANDWDRNHFRTDYQYPFLNQNEVIHRVVDNNK